MDVLTRDRDELKKYFVKNAIPTESDFSELIDGVLNQKSDGLVKLPNQPLTIEAGGNASTDQSAINFFGNIGNSVPDWRIELNNALSDADRKPGFHIVDGDNSSRLFIDKATGNVGVGVKDPSKKLHIAGDMKFDSRGSNIYFSDGGAKATLGTESHELRLGFAASNFNAYLTIGSWSMATRNNNVFNEMMRVVHNGNVGIGTKNPSARLHVQGGTTILEQEDWKEPVLLNNWIQYDGWSKVGYFKDSNGVVHLQGLITGGSGFGLTRPNIIYKLPVGYRPVGNLSISTVSGNEFAQCTIDTNGNVFAFVGKSIHYSLDSISFKSK